MGKTQETATSDPKCTQPIIFLQLAVSATVALQCHIAGSDIYHGSHKACNNQTNPQGNNMIHRQDEHYCRYSERKGGQSICFQSQGHVKSGKPVVASLNAYYLLTCRDNSTPIRFSSADQP